MRIACVDKSAADRVALQRRIEDAYTECRSTLGHARAATAYPLSKDELFVGARPEAVAIGPAWELERAYSLAKEVREIFPAIPILVLLSENNFSLRALRRFERLTPHVISQGDDSIRVVHAVLRIQDEHQSEATGELVCVTGVKGGVGATSIVSGLAHAFHAIGKSSVVVDLSTSSVFSIYMGCPRTTSVEYASILQDSHTPDPELLQKCLHESPNGVTFLATPSGGTEMRELWLRDPIRVELSLSIIDLLRESFDVVIVDIAHSEGLLPFALSCRAGVRLLVTSNDPASVHLLSVELKNLINAPGDGEIRIVFNTLNERGLAYSDVRNFIAQTHDYEVSEVDMIELSYDATARSWIGSGNTFYTEAKAAQQRVLESLCESICGTNVVAQLPMLVSGPGAIVNSFRNFFVSTFLAPGRKQKGLPLLPPAEESNSRGDNSRGDNSRGDNFRSGEYLEESSQAMSAKLSEGEVITIHDQHKSSEEFAAVESPKEPAKLKNGAHATPHEFVYQPPKMTINE